MEFYRIKHEVYIRNILDKRDAFSYGRFIQEHLAVPAVYWSLTALALLNSQISIELKNSIIDFLLSC